MMDRLLTDNDLMDATRAGNLDAFDDLVERYYQRLIAFLARFIGDADKAADLAQETFIRLLRIARQRDPETANTGNCSSLIFTIAANLGRDELRKRGRRSEMPLLEENAYRAPGETPDAIAQKKERNERVMLTLHSLPDDVRGLLILRDVQGNSYEDIANILGLKLGTVKSRINRARLVFKNEYLRREGIPAATGEGNNDELS